MDDISKVAEVCMKSNYVPPPSDLVFYESRRRRDEEASSLATNLDWLEDKDQWKILNQFVWYQAQTVLMEIYRRDGIYSTYKNGKPKKTCQQIGDKIVNYFQIDFASQKTLSNFSL